MTVPGLPFYDKMPREADIQRAIADFLSLRGFRVFRRNVMGIVPMPKGGVVRVGVRGQSDLFGWLRGTGRALEVEVKRPGKSPNPFQRAWLANAKADGVIAFVAHSVEECAERLKEFGI